MPRIVRDLPNIIPSSSGSNVSIGLGHLDDAASITIYVTSSAATASTGGSLLTIQISQFDPSDALPTGATESTQFFLYSPTDTGGLFTLTTGRALTIPNISFRGLRLINMTSAVAGEIIAFASKQITV